MNLIALSLIALGGAVGSVARALVGLAMPSRFPWGTLVVNVVGSLAIGWLMAKFGANPSEDAARMRHLLVVGFCGGFTTFSTFSWQTLEQLQKGQTVAAVLNVILSVALCLVAVALGFKLGRV